MVNNCCDHCNDKAEIQNQIESIKSKRSKIETNVIDRQHSDRLNSVSHKKTVINP